MGVSEQECGRLLDALRLELDRLCSQKVALAEQNRRLSVELKSHSCVPIAPFCGQAAPRPGSGSGEIFDVEVFCAEPPAAVGVPAPRCQFQEEASVVGKSEGDEQTVGVRFDQKAEPREAEATQSQTSVRRVRSPRRFNTKVSGLDAEDSDAWFAARLRKFLPTEGNQCGGRLAEFVKSQLFERTSFVVIILNVVYSMYKTDHLARTLSNEKVAWMSLIEYSFVAVFVIELGLKMVTYRGHMFFNKDAGWNAFDTLIVGSSVLELVMEYAGATMLDVGSMRILRTLRVLRLLRVFRAFRFLDELRLMVSCLLGSLPSLLWSSVLILATLLVFSLAFVQLVTQFQIDNPEKLAKDIVLKSRIEKHFSSIAVSMMALFQAGTGGISWGELFDVAAEVGPMGAITYTLFIVFFIFAFLNIITSIFVDNAMKLAEPDHEELLLQKRKGDRKLARELAELMREIDKDGDGMVSWEEMKRLHAHPDIRDRLDMAGISISDVDGFFSTLCNLSGIEHVDIDTFVSTCLQMKGGATSLDMQTVLVQLHEIHVMLDQVSERMHIAPRQSGRHSLSQPAPVRG